MTRLIYKADFIIICNVVIFPHLNLELIFTLQARLVTVGQGLIHTIEPRHENSEYSETRRQVFQ